MFGLVQHHKYSMSELENMFPFERDIYVEMLIDYLKEQEKRSKRK